ncbi:MAG: hydratase [Deltaproteobacteria bacterium]|nr:hydratase [Deltaproteobacteria bacterium]
MIEMINRGAFVFHGSVILEDADRRDIQEINGLLAQAGLAPCSMEKIDREAARRGTLAHQILAAHNQSKDMVHLQLRADSLASHDITYVGIIQTARASGMEAFPVPFVLTNCHNSLCAVGGTINEDDHLFGLSAARRYGGIFVPAHQAVIHQYIRETMAGCGRMILASDSHTRYGALGTMGFGEGGPEIVKQLLGRTYEIAYPEVIAVHLKGRPSPGVGPQDVALALIRAVFSSGAVKNKVLEFIGPGVTNLPIDFRNGIDVMTTETTCLSSIWRTDGQVEAWYRAHGRPEAYRLLEPSEVAYYDGIVEVDLDRVEPMIALPFHPSNAWPIAELNRNAREILREAEVEAARQIANPDLILGLTNRLVGGRLRVDQGIVAGCAGGTFDNLVAMAQIMDGLSAGNSAFSLGIYPASQPIHLELIRNGSIERLLNAGAVIRTAFCGPCFGAGDTPAHGGLSIRHTTRNFPNREGSKPTEGQIASVALMDARSIAATAVRGGILTAATEVDLPLSQEAYRFDPQVYEKKVYRGFGNASPEEPLRLGPNIADWPKILPLPENLLLMVASVILDPVTTTDELIPSGETSSYRSNPEKLAGFTLSRKDPAYVGRAKTVRDLEDRRVRMLSDGKPEDGLQEALSSFWAVEGPRPEAFRRFIAETGLGSIVVAVKPGDGSAREQAASCQKVLGGQANIALEYATKRYRSNLINWGMLPFLIDREGMTKLAVGDWIYIPGIRRAIEEGSGKVPAERIRGGLRTPLELGLGKLSQEERTIILAGCLINRYAG